MDRLIQRPRLSLFLLAGLIGCGGSPEASPPTPLETGNWEITRPRGTPREIDFETTEGTWMSVDISPDGKTLVFDLLAHIYRVDTEGGRATCLTQESGIATNFHPTFSPDGRHIAFVSDRAGQNNLWIMNADGSNPRPVHPDLASRHAEPAWSPDGRNLYATRFFPNRRGGWTKVAEIWRFPLDGGEPVKLIGTMQTQVWTPSPSRDGKFLYYHEATEPIVSADGYYKISDNHHIRRLEFATGLSEKVTDAQRRRYFRTLPLYDAAPALAPDDRRLAFVRNVPQGRLKHRGHFTDRQAGLWIRDLETGRDRLLMHPITPTQLRFHSMFHQKFVPGYAWAPDGRSLVLSQGGKLRRVDVRNGKVTTIPFKARVRRTISQQNRARRRIDLGPFEVRAARWPATSPDGKTLLFEAAGRLWRKELPDGTPERLTPDTGETAELSPTWSPDGTEVAYATWNDADGGHLWKIAKAGGPPVRLTRRAGAYLNPAWDPSGRSLIALRGPGAMTRGLDLVDNGWFDLVRIPADGGPGTVLHRLGPQLGRTQFARPFFGHDGRIYFTEATRSPADGSRKASSGSLLVSVAPHGGDRREHARFTMAEDVQLSPDGKRVAFHESHNIFVARYRTGSRYDHRSDDGIERVSSPAGRYPEWDRGGRLSFLSANRRVTVDLDTGTSRTVTLGLSLPSDFARGTIALTGARLITARGEEVIERGSILVKDGRIAGVGAVDVSGADRVIDLSGKTVLPGLVDVHAHNQAQSPDIIRPHNAQSAKYLAYGVTTAHDPAGRTNLTFPLGEMTRAGTVRGPRLFSAGRPLFSWGEDRHVITTRQDAADNVARLRSMGALSLKQYFQINRFQRQWIAEEARKHGDLMVTGEGMDLHYVLGTLMDGQTANEHPITYVPYYGDLIEFFARTGSVFSPTLVTPGGGHQMLEYFMARSDLPNDPRERNFLHWRHTFRQTTVKKHPISEYSSALVLAGIRQLYDRGVTIGLGGHGEIPGLSAHWSLWLHGKAVEPIEAIRIGTILSARTLGFERDIGSIEKGKLADLVILNSNPLEDLKNTGDILYVMQGGRLYDSMTLDEIWPRKRPFGPRPWKNPRILDAGGVRNDDHFDR